MAKYIDLDLAIDEIQKNKCGDLDYDCGIDVALAELKTMPAADVVEVIRCKDCKHYRDGFPYLTCDVFEAMATDENDFCSYAERREDG